MKDDVFNISVIAKSTGKILEMSLEKLRNLLFKSQCRNNDICKPIIRTMPVSISSGNIVVSGANSGYFLTSPIGGGNMVLTGSVDSMKTGDFWEIMVIDDSPNPNISAQFVGSPGTRVVIQTISISATGIATHSTVSLIMTGSPIPTFSSNDRGLYTRAKCVASSEGYRELRLIRNLSS